MDDPSGCVWKRGRTGKKGFVYLHYGTNLPESRAEDWRFYEDSKYGSIQGEIH